MERVLHGIFWLCAVLACVQNTGASSDWCTSEDLPTVVGPGSLRVSKHKYALNDLVQLVCLKGYEADGDSTSTCAQSQTFEPAQLRCVKQTERSCVASSLPPFTGTGAFAPVKTTYANGEKVELVCGQGYESAGPRRHVVCIGGAFFPWKSLKCKATTICSSADLPQIVGSGVLRPYKLKYKNTNTVKLQCRKGYKASGATTATCSGGAFSPNQLTCTRDTNVNLPTGGCQSLPVIVGPGIVTPFGTGYSESDVVTLQCPPGYEADGANTATCTNGQFAPQQLQCSKTLLPCTKGTPTVNGPGAFTPVQQSYQHGDEITLVCGNGFAPVMYEKATCIDGSFYPPRFRCKTKTYSCDSTTLPVIEGPGVLKPYRPSYQQNEVVTLRCRGGFTNQGASTATCTSGAFNPPKLTCV